MIILKLLEWDNCFSYGPGNRLFLNANRVTQIVGLNGAGKSSIPLITEEVLFNKNSKGYKKAKIANRYLPGGYFIRLVFDKDNIEYDVKVKRGTSSIKITLLKDGQDISSHTATGTFKTLQDIIGLDFKTFTQVIYQHPDSSLQFLKATDTTRKRFLIDLLHLEEYVRLFEVFKDAAKLVNSEKIQIESALATIERWLNNNKLSDTTPLPILKIEIDTYTDEKELGKLTAEIENISEKNQKINKNNSLKKQLRQINTAEFQNPAVTKKQSYDSEQSELGKVKELLRQAEQSVRKLKQLGDTCPTCEQDIDPEFKSSLINAELEIIESSQQKSQQLQRLIETIKKNNKLFEQISNLQREWENLYRSIDSTLPAEPIEESDLYNKLREVKSRLTKSRQKIKELTAENERRNQHNTRLQVIQEQTDAFIKELETYQSKLTEICSLLSNLELLKKAFSTNGVVAYKIENLVKELEELTNSYLADLSDGQFTLEFSVSNDKLVAQVTDNGVEVDITELSSGELARVNTATLLAIRKLMSSISESRVNVLFLDEVINVLDESGKEKLIELLMAESDLNTFIVSHQWTHPLVEKLEIVKTDNISRIE